MPGDPNSKPIVGHIEAGPNARILVVNELHGDIHAPQPPSSPDTESRSATLKRIREDWIDGVLNQSLYRVARIELGLATREDVVESPLNAIVQVPDREPVSIAPGTPMIEVFDGLGQSLLILGAPGTGKTTVLLELAKGLIARAESDPNHPIPAVFNLSTWALKRKPLAVWLVSELNLRTGVPKKLAQRWVNQDKVIPLLDGLDEVDAAHRAACLDAINEFRDERGLLPMAVCSRVADFEALGKKFRFRGAVTVQPLTKKQVDNYLCRSEDLIPIQTALRADASLSDLLETPLMLWVAMLAYRHAPVEMSKATTPEQRRTLLFENFVSGMFKRRAVPVRFSESVATRQLTWLAGSLTRSKQTVFYLEDLDFDWFRTPIQRLLARAAVAASCSVAAGFLFLLIIEVILGRLSGYGLGFREAVASWLSIGTIFGLISVSVKLKPKERVAFTLRQLPSRIAASAPSAVLVGATFGLGFLILLSLAGESRMYIRNAIGPAPTVLVSAAFGLLAGLGSGVLQVLTADAPQTRMVANQGTYNSTATAILVTMLFAPLGGFVGWSLTGIVGLLTLGPSIGLSAGLLTGGLFSIKHFTLRLLVWGFGGGPLRYGVFLNESAARLLLYRVGGGYIFVHRMLLEYFVSLQQTKHAYALSAARPAI
jgi:hypothetical protein